MDTDIQCSKKNSPYIVQAAEKNNADSKIFQRLINFLEFMLSVSYKESTMKMDAKK